MHYVEWILHLSKQHIWTFVDRGMYWWVQCLSIDNRLSHDSFAYVVVSKGICSGGTCPRGNLVHTMSQKTKTYNKLLKQNFLKMCLTYIYGKSQGFVCLIKQDFLVQKLLLETLCFLLLVISPCLSEYIIYQLKGVILCCIMIPKGSKYLIRRIITR